MNKPLLELEDITKEFGKDEAKVIALKNINFTINVGDFVAITGPSGCGKTTLLNLIAGLIDTTTGKILFDGNNILEWNDVRLSEYRNQDIGYIMQNFGLIDSFNVIKNVLLPIKKNRNKYRDKAREKLILLDILEKQKSFPHQLSGGQKQRVAIARSLINNPKILLADEPTGALDVENSQMIMNHFKKLNKSGITVILVTHDEKLAKQCNRIIRIQDGKTVNTNKI